MCANCTHIGGGKAISESLYNRSVIKAISESSGSVLGDCNRFLSLHNYSVIKLSVAPENKTLTFGIAEGIGSKSVASGWLQSYLKQRILRDGTIASYPRIFMPRDPWNIWHWFWDYVWWEKNPDGQWRKRKRYVPRNSVKIVQSLISASKPIEIILLHLKGGER